ncbi:hypothetical protein CCMSSC00406_0007056 [Pleurotus cornucopiae]|uniref:Uncharacterized protein n=1 Tax=Pleurotus cornucopiae TaxID=5321 RepID=A0ACB7J5G1_PLECO|nr:hypothetical protein CCMSSC00406_0007056 [Pleurotus cornucopiae]
MVIAIPVEIAHIIMAYVADKGSLANLLLVSHAFRLLAEPLLYYDVSFLAPFRQDRGGWGQSEGRSDADISAVANSFLHGITAGGGVCARYVKRIYLPGVAFRGAQYALFQSILQSTPNLEDLQVHFAWWMEAIELLDLRAFFTGPRSRCSSPPFALKTFAWYTPDVQPSSLGLGWFLSTQKSLERLLLPNLVAESCPPFLPTLPRLRVLHASTIVVAKQFRKANQVTHLMLERGPMGLDAAGFVDVVVCVARRSSLHEVSAAMAWMPRLECLEIDTSRSPIPKTLSRVGALKGAAKLRHLRFFPNQVLLESEAFHSHPWDYGDVANIFNTLPSLTHVSFLLSPAPTNYCEYCCFIKGSARPVKLRALRPQVSKDDLYEWWDDWIEDYAVVPFEPSDPRMGYQGDLLS